MSVVFKGVNISVPGVYTRTITNYPGGHHYHIISRGLDQTDGRGCYAYSFMFDLLVRLNVVD